jgi:organic hydroperoxide reductase OsmC/OhrA
MHPYPHQYRVTATASAEGVVTLGSTGLADIPSMPPPEFDGPPGYWSPETLLIAAVADCYVLSFRSVARAGKVGWTSLAVDVEGVLERVDGVTRFTRFTTRARLVVPAGTDPAKARASLDRAEKVCLITNSLNGERHLEAEVVEG